MQGEENDRADEPQEEGTPPRRRRSWTTRLLMALTGVAVVVLLLILLAVVYYRTGGFDSYVKQRFVDRMAEMGMVFDAEAFNLRVNPLELHLRNATFKDKLTGELLFSVREAHLKMTVQDLYALQASRDITIDTTDITGAEVWVRFDENGRSNFSNLKFVEDERGSAVNFRYESVVFALRDSVVHFGDVSRKISGEGRNITFLLSPAGVTTADGRSRYNIDLTSTDSSFTYDTSTVDKIDIRAVAVADDTGADITRFEIRTPIGETSMTGRLTDWNSPRYELDVTSTIDLTQASSVLPIGTPITGVGNFKGKVSGQGETYRIEGEADSASLRAEGISLKGVNIAATVNGVNDSYEANGRAVAEMLTFEDLKIDFLRAVGNVRGTGTDFRWWGELQAAAASTKDLTMAGLFLSDAVAEYKDRQLTTNAGYARAQKFAIDDKEFAELSARNLRFLTDDRGGVRLTAPGITARSFKTPDYALNGLTGTNARVSTAGSRMRVEVDRLKADNGTIDKARLRNVSADRFDLTDEPGSTRLTASNLRADRVDQAGTVIDGIEAPSVEVRDDGRQTVIYSNRLRVAKINTGDAILGSLNIGGVRLTIRQGVIEGRTDDIDAGNVTLAKTRSLPEGGELREVRIAKPVFVLEPSGRYRASADMTIGGGTVGSIPLGNANARVNVSSDRVDLSQLTARLMEGTLTGEATIAFSGRGQSRINGDFTDLDLSKLLSIQGGRVIPLEGKTTGRVDLSFTGTSFRNASGTVNADIRASAGLTGGDTVPVTGQVRLSATNGLFNVDVADLNTAKSNLKASGRFDLRDDNSDLTLALRSTDATEIDRLVRILDLSPALEQQLDELQVQVAGNLTFDGRVTGNLYDPVVDGKASLDSIAMQGRGLGSVTTDIAVSPAGVELRNGKLLQADGGNAVFAVNMPRGGANNVSVTATLTNVDAGNLLAALPISLPERIRDLDGRTTGTVNISGLPDAAQGEVNLAAASGTIAGQAFDNLKVRALFNGTLVDLQQTEMNIGAGVLTAKGTYDRSSEAFNLELTGKAIPAPLAVALAPQSDSIPSITGDVDFTASASGVASRTSSYNVNFSGAARRVQVGETTLGEVTFKGNTVDQVLTADLTANFDGRPQVINATVNFGNDNLPLTASTEFNNSPLAPFLAFVPQLKDFPISGTGTGRVEFGGNIASLDRTGKRVFSADGLSGSARFTQLALQIQDTPLTATEPVEIRFNPSEIIFDRARFAGGGSNMTIAGTKALTDSAQNNLAIDGRVNLSLLPVLARDTFRDVFFSGFADTSVRLTGTGRSPILSGTASVINGSVAAFLGSDRFQADRIRARVIFTSDQVQIEDATGYLGGGRFTASGGGYLRDLSIMAFRFGLNGDNVTVPLPKDFTTTGDARLELTGVRAIANDPRSQLVLTVSGRVFARRSLYTKDIDLASIVSGRQDPVLSGGGGGSVTTRFENITIEGRDALVVRNNIADLTASVSLSLSGDAENPRVSGRVTANSGTIFFRKDRYVVQRGVLEFPPDTEIDPVVNLQAETEIAGYQVFVNLSGPLRDTEQLNATVRSSPALPQADVVSLITTGTLANTAGGIPTLAQSGINTAAEVLTDAIINQPIRKATDKLFGLNVFEIDPIISGQQNASARLTVGRQINNNLRVTYSTNLSQDQQQVLALEYRVSDRLSFVAQYEQRSLTNVTRNRDNFSFEIRLRKRF